MKRIDLGALEAFIRSRLAAVEAERDAARAALAGAMATAESLAEERDNAVARSTCFEAEIMNVHLKRAMLVVQRDAAQAGEARAVEVIQKLLKSAVPNRRDHPTMWDAWAFAERFLKEESRALGWLAQQRAEAAAEENDRWADDWWAWDGDCTASDFTARAAALRAGEVGNE